MSTSQYRLGSASLSAPHYVVIGIDFGTTFSGVSWTWSQAASPDQIERVHNWEVDFGSAKNQQADKVPSKICYDDYGRVLKWGYTVTASHRNQAAWFKLLLSEEAREKGGARVEETRRLLRKLGKTSVDVVADYLSCLWQHAIGAIELALTKIAVDNMTFRVVLTLPANWDPNAIDLTKKAAIQAGITAARSRGPTIFRTVSEPEAAALAAFKESGMRWRPDFQLGDTFVVCDAGGGTVDLISYTITSLEPLRLKMCVEATGGLCGAVYLDEGFDRTIRTIVGSSTYEKLDVEVKARVFEQGWEFQAKRLYNGPEKLPNQFPVDIPGYKPKKSGLFGKRPSSTIILNPGLVSAIYQPVVGQIVDLVRTQVLTVEEETSKAPKAVLLVGGFGENNFLRDQLEYTFPQVPIQRPSNAIGAISRGAVLKGLSASAETETVTNFISKLSYGVKHNSRFDPSKHLFRDKFKDPYTNLDMARDQFTWYLRRGQSVSKSDPVRYAWTQPLRSSWQLKNVHGEIWVSGLKIPPTRLTPDAKKLCEIHCNFDESIFYELVRKKSTGDENFEYRDLDYTLNMKVAAGELEWVIFWRDREKGKARTEVTYEGVGGV